MRINKRLLIPIVLTVGVLSALWFSPHPAGAGPAYQDGSTYSTTGPVVIDIPLLGQKSQADKRTVLEVTATFPTDSPGAGVGPYPLIVFSHGYGGAPNGYQHLIDYWASHGYVVLAPTHADAAALKLGNPIEAMSKELSDPAACKQRIADMENILNSLPLIEKKIPQLKGKIDSKHIAAAGHSFGAYTTQLLGGATVSYPGDKPGESFTDPRLRCVLMLSPQGANKMGLTPISWDHMTGPAMTMTGSKDFPFDQKGGPATRLDPYKNAPAGDKYLVYIDGANHFTFCDLESNMESRRPLLKRRHEREGMSQTTMYDYVEAASLAFLDAYLKGDGRAKSYLKSTSMSTSSGGIVHVSSK